MLRALPIRIKYSHRLLVSFRKTKNKIKGACKHTSQPKSDSPRALPARQNLSRCCFLRLVDFCACGTLSSVRMNVPQNYSLNQPKDPRQLACALSTQSCITALRVCRSNNTITRESTPHSHNIVACPSSCKHPANFPKAHGRPCQNGTSGEMFVLFPKEGKQ